MPEFLLVNKIIARDEIRSIGIDTLSSCRYKPNPLNQKLVMEFRHEAILRAGHGGGAVRLRQPAGLVAGQQGPKTMPKVRFWQ